MKKPNFFIIGAPKCGTTSMAAWLSTHPDIFMSKVKEPHYFNTDHKVRGKKNLDDYEKLFAHAPENSLAVGEASTNYLYSNEAVPNILKYNPSAKFLVMIRNPVDMAYSLHDYTYFGLTEHIESFEEAWRLQNERAIGKHLSPRCIEPKFLLYKERCRLGFQLQRLYSRVSRDQVHVIIFDDLKSNPHDEYRKVLAFLDVNDDGRQKFSVYNSARERKSRLLSQLIKSVCNTKKKLNISKGVGILNTLDRKNTVIRQ